MKKNINLILIFLICIFFNIKIVNGSQCEINDGSRETIRGTYSYDINNFIINNSTITMDGWGLLNASNGIDIIHNIQPNFTLTLEYYSGETYLGTSSKIYTNKINRSSVAPSNARPNDFTSLLYNKFTNSNCENKLYYSQYSKGERSSQTCALNTYYDRTLEKNMRNTLYLDLDFEFEITINEMKEDQKRIFESTKKIPDRVYFRLEIKQEGGNKTVFGNNISVEGRKESCIPISFTDKVISGKLDKIFVKNIFAKRTSLQIAILNGQPRSKPSADMQIWVNENSLNNGKLAEQRGIGQGPHFRTQYSYNILNENISTIDGSTNKTQLLMYPIKIEKEINRGVWQNSVVNSTKAINNSTVVKAYIPSIWIKPYLIGKGTYIELDPKPLQKTCEDCKTNWTDECYTLNCCNDLCTFNTTDDSYKVDIEGKKGATVDLCKTYCCSEKFKLSEDKKNCCETENESPICLISSKLPEDCNDYEPEVSRIEKVTNNQSINKYCSASCKETSILLIEPKIKVKAGMGFNYPLYVSVENSCTVTFNHNLYDTEIRNAISSKNYSQINTINDNKKACFDYINDKNITPKGNVELTIETSKEKDYKEKLEFKEIKSSVVKNENKLASYYCVLDDITYSPTSKPPVCSNENRINFISGISSLEGYYTLKDRILEFYSGNIVSEMMEGKTFNAGDRFYTSYYEKSGIYNIVLKIENIGNYTKSNPGEITCSYKVDNTLFPQEDDPNFPKYGSLGFMFRVVEVSDPFPNREPRLNWKSTPKEQIRDFEGTIYYINLDTTNRRTILEYNKSQNFKYDSFINISSKTGKSKFIEENDKIFTIKKR